MDGYIKLHRRILDNPVVCKDSDYFAVWIYLILNATHTNMLALFGGKKIILLPGQLLTGRKSISEKLCIEESKVQRILKKFEIEQQIAQQTSNKNRLITILNWNKYQNCEQQIEHQVNNNCTTDEQQLNTNNNVNKDINKDINNISASQQRKAAVLEFFESVWKLYPHKRGKAGVSFTQKEKLYKIGYEEISGSIDRYVRDLKKDMWRDPQNGSTFFNKGYIDYLSENYVEPDGRPKESQSYSPKKTAFQNFDERDTDYDAMVVERLQERLKRENDEAGGE